MTNPALPSIPEEGQIPATPEIPGTSVGNKRKTGTTPSTKGVASRTKVTRGKGKAKAKAEQE